MPQFDIFVWFTLSFYTLFVSHFFYFFILRFLAVPFSKLQKFVVKINLLHFSKALDLLLSSLIVFKENFFLLKFKKSLIF